MKKRTLALVLLITLVFSNTISVYAEGVTVQVSIDGQYINFTEESGQPFIDENGRTQVPLRAVGEAIEAYVDWDQASQFAILQKGTSTIIVPIGQNYIYHEGERIFNDTVATIINNRTYLPIRIVLEALGYEVGWEQETFTVSIISPTQPDTPPEEETDEETPEEESSLPVSYDGREVNKMSTVKEQGDIGACWAFATIGALETRLMPDFVYDFSEDHISLNHGYSLTQDDGGEYKIALAYLTGWKGPILEEEDPYGDGETVEAKAAVHLQEAIFIEDKDFDAIKEAVMKYGAVQTSVYSPVLNGDDNSLYYNQETHSMYNDGNNVQDHDIIIIGWDDNYSANNFEILPEGDGAFICKNSWGDEFGEDGYYYVSYYDTHIGTNNVVYTVIENNDNYDNIYQHDELGWITNVGYEVEKAMVANVYTAIDDEILEAISFYALGKDTSYKLYVVEDFEDTSSFSQRVLVLEDTISMSGYYTINLPEDIYLSKGEQYSVILEITTPGLTHPVAVEMASSDQYSDEAIINPGESYMSYYGMEWLDLEGMGANACLKAFTNNVEE